MKRDMNFIRDILLLSEEKTSSFKGSIVEEDDFEKRTREEIFGHVKLLEEFGLLEEGGHTQSSVGLGNLTWFGHEFLDSIRDPEVWKKTQEAAQKAGGWSFEIISDLAKGFIKTTISKHTGVEF